MDKLVNIPINGDYWRRLIDLFDFSTPYGLLDGREKDLLAGLLELNWRYKDIPKKEKFMLVLGASARKEICGKYGMSMEVLNNKLSSLRRKGVILDDNGMQYIPDKIVNNMQLFDSITFKFVSK